MLYLLKSSLNKLLTHSLFSSTSRKMSLNFQRPVLSEGNGLSKIKEKKVLTDPLILEESFISRDYDDNCTTNIIIGDNYIRLDKDIIIGRRILQDSPIKCVVNSKYPGESLTLSIIVKFNRDVLNILNILLRQDRLTKSVLDISDSLSRLSLNKSHVIDHLVLRLWKEINVDNILSIITRLSLIENYLYDRLTLIISKQTDMENIIIFMEKSFKLPLSIKKSEKHLNTFMISINYS